VSLAPGAGDRSISQGPTLFFRRSFFCAFERPSFRSIARSNSRSGTLPVSLSGPIANPTTRQKSFLTLMNSKANRLWGRDPPVYCNLLSSCDRTSEQKSRCPVVGFAIQPDRLTGSSPVRDTDSLEIQYLRTALPSASLLSSRKKSMAQSNVVHSEHHRTTLCSMTIDRRCTVSRHREIRENRSAGRRPARKSQSIVKAPGKDRPASRSPFVEAPRKD
jgi:hypothetical protein